MVARATGYAPGQFALFALFAPFAAGCLDWGSLENGRCGDGFVGREEECDDSNRSSGDGCSERCKAEDPSQCGNGRTERGEACDDGNRADGDGCSQVCELEPIGPQCGDGELDTAEICDDGNEANDDACLNGCSRATCGDGQLRRHVEECDQGNVGAGIACTPACLSCGSEPGSHFRAANQHCFTLHTEPLTQADARSTCQAEDGDLWTVTSKAEGIDVAAKLSLTGPYWLGLVTTGAGVSSWVTGEAFRYASFDQAEPSAPASGCVSLEVTQGDAEDPWQSRECSMLLSFVCERAGVFISLASNHAYKLRTAAVSFQEAQRLCQSEGGYLATLETSEERSLVAGKVDPRIWVDATDAASEGNFVWSTGVAVDPAEFRAGQPNDSDGSQGCLFLDGTGRLADERCEQTLAFLCEID